MSQNVTYQPNFDEEVPCPNPICRRLNPVSATHCSRCGVDLNWRPSGEDKMSRRKRFAQVAQEDVPVPFIYHITEIVLSTVVAFLGALWLLNRPYIYSQLFLGWDASRFLGAVFAGAAVFILMVMWLRIRRLQKELNNVKG